MSERITSTIIAVVSGIAGYAVISIGLAAILGSEVAPAALAFAFLGTPLAVVVGMVVGSRLYSRPRSACGWSLVWGGLIPVIAMGIIMLFLGFQQEASKAKSQAQNNRVFEAAKAQGFPFPPGTRAGYEGSASSTMPMSEVEAFYDSQKGWNKGDFKTRVWYVRANGQRFDRVTIGTFYGRTEIHFGTKTKAEMQTGIAGEFAGAASSGEWTTAALYCVPSLTTKKIRENLDGSKPSSSAFQRRFFPDGATARIAVNVNVAAGGRATRTGEVGFFFTEDLIPRIQKIEPPKTF